MVDGEAVMMTMVMICSESPSGQGARMELLILGIEIASVAERRCVSRNMTNPPSIFRSRALSSPKGSVGGVPEVATPYEGAGPPLAAPSYGVVASCGHSVPHFGSVGLPVNYDDSNKNRGFS